MGATHTQLSLAQCPGADGASILIESKRGAQELIGLGQQVSKQREREGQWGSSREQVCSFIEGAKVLGVELDAS